MINGIDVEFSAFLVHSYPDLKKNRLYLLGRLTDGRSFAAVEEEWRPYIHIFEHSFRQAARLFETFKTEEAPALNPFSGLKKDKLICFKFANYNDRSRASRLLEENSIQSPDADIKPAELFLIEKQIKGPLLIKGIPVSGKKVDMVFRKPEISPHTESVSVPLRIASVDIETDVVTGVIRAVSIAWTQTHNNNIADNAVNGKVRILSAFHAPHSPYAFFHDDEKSMLASFLEDIRIIDPDILTGWNFLDFDFPHLARRFEKFGLSFNIGRSKDSAKFFPGDDGGKSWRRRSAAAIVPGRQVLDALRIMRAGTQWTAGQGFSLEEIAQKVLGEGKTVHETGDEKIAALDRLYLNDPSLFGEYCLRDSQLVLRILSKTGLYRLTMERACLTGVSLDKAWTSVVSFERVYGMQLRKKGIAPAVPDTSDVTGAAGGTVLESEQGLFNNVAVFDFRSLYPTVMRTFNIDPLSHARAAENENKEKIIAPNGAEFSREPGLLPSLISEYFATRAAALEKGDSIAAQVYKILMNSFYGVLGTSS
jgi:DNA polymerase-2